MRRPWLKKTAVSLLALTVTAGVAGCSSTPYFDSALAKKLEAKRDLESKVRCDHLVRDLWLCTYEPDLASNSYAEVIVRRGAGDCWTAREGRLDPRARHPYSPHSYSFGRHEAIGPRFGGCT